METNRVYDLVILGATGFTGQFVLEEVLRECSSRQQHRVCVAGRNKMRLQSGLEAAGRLCGVDVQSVAIEVADVTDQQSLLALAGKTRLLLSCVGPFREHGFEVAEACVSCATDYLDISGEPQYLEAVQALLSSSAKKKGVHVVGSCGFDSVPADMGTIFLQDNFPGELCHVEMVVGHGSGDGSTTSIHATTLQCAVLGYANKDKLRANRAKILSSDTPLSSHRPPKRGMLWHDSVSRQWCLANIGSDRSVVTRTQHLLYQLEGRSPLHFAAYFGMHSIPAALKAIIFGVVFVLMGAANWSRNLLIKYPEVLTLGMFSWAGPKRDQLARQTFCVTLTGYGWTDTDKPVQERGRPDTVRHCKVAGPDPGYFGTALIVVQCAFTMLEEKTKLPNGGGVFTPGAAFLHTSLISRLQTRGVNFSLVEDGEHN